MTYKRRWILWSILVVGLAPFLWGLTFRGTYHSRQRAEQSLTLAENFTLVRKILVRKNGARHIVELGGDSDFVSQEWDKVDGAAAAAKLLDPNWRLELRGTLTVRTRDPYVGRQEVELAQAVEITADYVASEVRLARPAGRLQDYVMTTRFSRTDGDQTRVELRLEQEILTDAPWFAHAIADRRVLAAVEKTLANQQAGIRRFIADNREDVPLFPWR